MKHLLTDMLSYFCLIQYYILSSWLLFFFFKQKTAYEMRISDWSSDVCYSDLVAADEIKEERCQLRDEIIKEFYKELTVEDLVADVVDLPEDVGKTRTIVACAMVGANFLHAGDRLPDPLRQPAHHPYPLQIGRAHV